MAGKPAARKNDKTLHVPVMIKTGSPDTTICGKAAARLTDIATACPAPPCKPPMGKIVSSSTTVFINGLGAARIGDLVLDSAAATPPGPGGCSHPAAQGYQARPADHYEPIMEIEHEASEWDEVDDYQRQKLDGKRDEVVSPIGIVPGKRRKSGAKKKSKAKPYASSESPSPWGGSGGGPAGDVPSGGGSKMGESSAGGLAGDEKPEEERPDKPKQLNLEFPIDLKFGSRSGMGAMAPAPNKIALGCFTVFIG